VARNRKRAKDRGPREPQEAAIARSPGDPRAAIARSPGELREPLEPRGYAAGDELALGGGDLVSPDPLAHASPDAELAEAQLALGSQAAQRPGANGAGAPGQAEAEPDALGASEVDEAAEADLGDGEQTLRTGAGRPSRRRAARGESGSAAAPGGALPARPAPAEPLPLRLVGFLQGSWRELQRVQWPDRRQVMQATWVVIGFVIVAGILLGVSDLLAKRIVDFILYGHFS